MGDKRGAGSLFPDEKQYHLTEFACRYGAMHLVHLGPRRKIRRTEARIADRISYCLFCLLAAEPRFRLDCERRAECSCPDEFVIRPVQNVLDIIPEHPILDS